MDIDHPAPELAGQGSLPGLGAAALTRDELTEVVRACVGGRVDVLDAVVSPIVPTTAISTASVARVSGTARQGARCVPWSVLVKVLRSPRHWPGIDGVPGPLRQGFIDTYPWRVEADALGSDLPGRLPPGMRTPRVFRIDELEDDRVAMWLEYVETGETPWPVARYATAARLLGRWAGRRLGDTHPPEPAAAAYGLRGMTAGFLTHGVFPGLRDEHLWTHPLLSEAAGRGLRRDLLGLVDAVPDLLDALDDLPQSVGHGDACPQNLLVPAREPEGFVAIDISWQTPEALGFDLGQLLAGRAESGQLAARELPALREVVLDAYLTGLRQEGHDVAPADVAFGCDAALLIRSAFTAVPLQPLGGSDGPARDAEIVRGLALARWVTGLGLALCA